MVSIWKRELYHLMESKISSVYFIIIIAYFRGHWGKPFSLTFRYIPPNNPQPEDFELWTHSNETIAALRRHLAKK